MRHLPWLALVCALLAPGGSPAHAGAWLPPEGRGFASMTTRLTWPKDYGMQGWRVPQQRYDTLYVDYGLGRRFAVGLDLGRSISGSGKALIFLRRALKDEGPLRLAAELGLGQIEGASALRPGLSLGRGQAWGWINADLLAEMRGSHGTDFKLDLTLGLTLRRGAKAILQIQSGLTRDDPPFARLAPSVVVPLHRRLQAEVGASWGLTGDDSAGLLLGLWSEF